MEQRRGDARQGPRGIYYGWVVVATVALLLAVSSGGRFLFGVVLKPFSEEFGWSRAQLASAVTINVVFLTLLQPVIGWAADRWGSRPVLLLGVAATALMSLPLTFATRLWQVYLLYGALASLAFAATSPVNTTRLINGWFVKRRGLALSIGTSGAAFGQLAIVPLATWVMVTWSWRTSYWALAAVALLVLLPLGLFAVRDAPPGTAETEDGGRKTEGDGGDARAETTAVSRPPSSVSLRQALRTPIYWQLSFGFFVCGFTMSFTSVHMVPYMLDMPEHSQHTMQLVASSALSVVGGCSIAGALALGYLADRAGHKPILALTYFLRGLAFLILLLVGPSVAGIFVAAVVLGISWTSTTPLTSALAADVYGRASLGTIFGFMFSSMNIGGGVGAWLAGFNYDLTGNYQTSLLLNGFFGFAAALAVLSARARPLRPIAATAQQPPAERQPALTGMGDD